MRKSVCIKRSRLLLDTFGASYTLSLCIFRPPGTRHHQNCTNGFIAHYDRPIQFVSSIMIMCKFDFRQVTDDEWDANVIEYTALNITGFRIIDTSRRHVRDFLDGWKRLDPLTSAGAGKDTISVSRFSSLFEFREKKNSWKESSFDFAMIPKLSSNIKKREKRIRRSGGWKKKKKSFNLAMLSLWSSWSWTKYMYCRRCRRLIHIQL